MQISEARGLAKQKWTQEIVADELCKPLEMSKKFVQDFHEQEKKEQETEKKTVEHHLKSLNKLKERGESQQQVIDRSPSAPTQVFFLVASLHVASK